MGAPDIPPKLARPNFGSYASGKPRPDHLTTGIFDSRLINDLQSRLPGVLVYFWDLTKITDAQRDKVISEKIATYQSYE